MTAPFADRTDAGRQLGQMLLRELSAEQRADLMVLGLPRGGVPVAAAVAAVLGVQFDILPVRKLGLPFDPELAMGAVAPGAVVYRDEEIIAWHHVSDTAFDYVLQRERAELERRMTRYRAGSPPPVLAGRTVVVVDDGLATGATMQAALLALRGQGAACCVVAVPVAPAGAAERFRDVADQFVCVHTPVRFDGVSRHYDDFSQTTDAEVLACLALPHGPLAPSGIRT
ncbi:phosphoribosyltransferase [Imbroritus primus]|uniref:phosphoribosyltransferase n=1 Tax=Imbroritus primus TaxID=3058603 RepID=UPI003D160AAE